MTVQVLVFGVLRELLGTSAFTLDTAEPATAGDVLRQVQARVPGKGGRVWETLAVAVNEQYADRSTTLKPGDVVALLPPVSGGAVARTSGSRLIL